MIPGDFVGAADGRGLSPLETPTGSGERGGLPGLHLPHHQHPHHPPRHRGPLAGQHLSMFSEVSIPCAGGVSSGAVLGPVGDCDGHCPARPLLRLLLHSAQVRSRRMQV